MPTLTIDSIVICQTHAGDLRTFVHGMHPGSKYAKIYIPTGQIGVISPRDLNDKLLNNNDARYSTV
jgi:hypothetical protein